MVLLPFVVFSSFRTLSTLHIRFNPLFVSLKDVVNPPLPRSVMTTLNKDEVYFRLIFKSLPFRSFYFVLLSLEYRLLYNKTVDRSHTFNRYLYSFLLYLLLSVLSLYGPPDLSLRANTVSLLRPFIRG